MSDKFLTLDNLSPAVKNVQYAVRVVVVRFCFLLLQLIYVTILDRNIGTWQDRN